MRFVSPVVSRAHRSDRRDCRLALALKTELLAIGRPISFSGATPLDGQAADAREEVRFVIGGDCAAGAAESASATIATRTMNVRAIGE
jgi:hypothetical protein